MPVSARSFAETLAALGYEPQAKKRAKGISDVELLEQWLSWTFQSDDATRSVVEFIGRTLGESNPDSLFKSTEIAALTHGEALAWEELIRSGVVDEDEFSENNREEQEEWINHGDQETAVRSEIELLEEEMELLKKKLEKSLARENLMRSMQSASGRREEQAHGTLVAISDVADSLSNALKARASDGEIAVKSLVLHAKEKMERFDKSQGQLDGQTGGHLFQQDEQLASIAKAEADILEVTLKSITEGHEVSACVGESPDLRRLNWCKEGDSQNETYEMLNSAMNSLTEETSEAEMADIQLTVKESYFDTFQGVAKDFATRRSIVSQELPQSEDELKEFIENTLFDIEKTSLFVEEILNGSISLSALDFSCGGDESAEIERLADLNETTLSELLEKVAEKNLREPIMAIFRETQTERSNALIQQTIQIKESVLKQQLRMEMIMMGLQSDHKELLSISQFLRGVISELEDEKACCTKALVSLNQHGYFAEVGQGPHFYPLTENGSSDQMQEKILKLDQRFAEMQQAEKGVFIRVNSTVSGGSLLVPTPIFEQEKAIMERSAQLQPAVTRLDKLKDQ